MKPTPELITDWHEKARQMAIQADGYFDDVEHWRHFAELAAQWGADKAQQTTDPLGFQIRRAIAAEDELRATKQTLEHAYAALQKVADAQAAIEEPALPDAVAYTHQGEIEYVEAGGHAGSFYGAKNNPDLKDAPDFVGLYTDTQTHDHYQAGVRAGMGQSQDAKRWQFIDACQDLTPFLREYHSGVCLSIEEINKAMKGGQK